MGGARSILASLSRARARGRLAGAIARASLAAAAGAGIALAVHAPDARPEARLERVAGTLAIANSENGAAILSASHMRPGDAASGTVTIANAGSVPGDFSLSSFDLTDTPGRGGGLLSSFLAATVQDVTDPAAAHDVYRGPLGAMPVRPLGTFAAGEQRIYAFRVELPVAAPGLDAVQGASVSVGYRWDATGIDYGNRTNPTDTTPTAPTTPT